MSKRDNVLEFDNATEIKKSPKVGVLMAAGSTDIGIASQGANMGALQIMSRRMEQAVARAVLRDLWDNGLLVVRQDDWSQASRLVFAIREVVGATDGAD